MPTPRIIALALCFASSACGHVVDYGPSHGHDDSKDAPHGSSDVDDAEAVVPAATEFASPPAHARVEDACAPDGGPAVRIRVGLAAARCDTDPAGTDLLLFVFHGGPLAPATYELDRGGGFAFLQTTKPIGIKSGRVTITAWDEHAVTATYALNLPDGGVLAGSFSGPVCPGEAACG
jgi:hypothetical protein